MPDIAKEMESVEQRNNRRKIFQCNVANNGRQIDGVIIKSAKQPSASN